MATDTVFLRGFLGFPKLDRRTDQLVGAVLDALDERGHEEALAALSERYRESSGRLADRERLARALVAALMEALEPDDCVAVLAEGVGTLLDRFSGVLAAAPVAIVALDADDRVRLWNPAAERILGWSEREVLGRAYPATAVRDGSVDLGRLRDGESITGADARHRRADGSTFDARVWAAPLDDAGAYAGAILIVADVTDRRRRRERLAVLNRVLRHNIRNDVNVIRGYVDLLAADLPDGDERVAAVRRRVEDVLELSETARRVERLAGDEERTAADAAAVVRERVRRLRRTGAEADVGLDLPERAPVLAHRLLPYAFDALLERLADGGSVVVTAETSGTPGVTIRLAADADLRRVERRILDGGSETPVRHSDGTGLWLARWIVGESGGELRVDGETVVVELPAPPGGRDGVAG